MRHIDSTSRLHISSVCSGCFFPYKIPTIVQSSCFCQSSRGRDNNPILDSSGEISPNPLKRDFWFSFSFAMVRCALFQSNRSFLYCAREKVAFAKYRGVLLWSIPGKIEERTWSISECVPSTSAFVAPRYYYNASLLGRLDIQGCLQKVKFFVFETIFLVIP